MSDISVYINPQTGDYLLKNGTIQNNNSVLSEIYFCLNTPLGTYIGDRNMGNALLLLKVVPPQEKIIQNIKLALAPLIVTNRIDNVNIQVLVYTTSAYTVSIKCQDAVGNQINFKWDKDNG